MKKKTQYVVHAWWLFDCLYFRPKTIKRARKLAQKLKNKNWQVAVWREIETKSSFYSERLWRELKK